MDEEDRGRKDPCRRVSSATSGSTREQRAKVRLLSATNRDLEKEVKNGNFREDLFYRIDVMTLRLPPLRERREDIPFLAAHFAGEDWNIEPRAMNALQYYQWPGNVRQLINAIERAKILSDDEIIHLEHLPKSCCGYRAGTSPWVIAKADSESRQICSLRYAASE